MEEISNNSKSNNLPLKLLAFLLGTIITIGVFFSAYGYKKNNTDFHDQSYGAISTSQSNGVYYCLVVDPSIGCDKTIHQASDQAKNEVLLFATVTVLIETILLSIFIWLIFRNTNDILIKFLYGSLLGLIIAILFLPVYNFQIASIG